MPIFKNTISEFRSVSFSKRVWVPNFSYSFYFQYWMKTDIPNKDFFVCFKIKAQVNWKKAYSHDTSPDSSGFRKIVTTGADKQLDEPIRIPTRNLLKVQEKSRAQVVIGFGFASHWLINWREIFKPITSLAIAIA